MRTSFIPLIEDLEADAYASLMHNMDKAEEEYKALIRENEYRNALLRSRLQRTHFKTGLEKLQSRIPKDVSRPVDAPHETNNALFSSRRDPPD